MMEQTFDMTFFRGRVGLHAILKSLGIGQGDEVATQALTCVAVPEAIMATGAIPLWIDIEKNSVNMAPDSLAERITENTRAIVIQHTFGIPADITRLMDIANSRSIPVIEDCCHTLNSLWEGKTVGSFGVGAFYSFEWGKPVVVGIGGAVRINDLNLLKIVRESHAFIQEPPVTRTARIRVQYLAYKTLMRPLLYWPLRSAFHILGRLKVGESNYNPIRPGNPSPEFGWKLSRHHRDLLAKKLAHYPSFEKAALENTNRYDEAFFNMKIKTIPRPEKANSVLVRYPLFVDKKEFILTEARKANIEIASWYATPIHPLTKTEWPDVLYKAGSCPTAEVAAKRLVSFPLARGINLSSINKTMELIGHAF